MSDGRVGRHAVVTRVFYVDRLPNNCQFFLAESRFSGELVELLITLQKTGSTSHDSVEIWQHPIGFDRIFQKLSAFLGGIVLVKNLKVCHDFLLEIDFEQSLNKLILVFERLVKYSFPMARPKLHKREETLKKALSFFWKNGFSGGSTRELGQALEMHPGSLYSTFGSKEKLYLEAIELYGQQSEEAFKSCFEDTNFFVGLSRYLNRLVASDDHPSTCFLAKTYSSQLSADRELAEKARELVTGYRRFISRRIAQAQDNGELKPEVDPDAFASVVQTQIMGLRTLADSAPGTEVMQRAVSDVVGILKSAAIVEL